MKLRRWGVWGVRLTTPPETARPEQVGDCYTKWGANRLYRWYVEHEPRYHFWVSGPR